MILKVLGFLLLSLCTTQIFGQYVLRTSDGKDVKLNPNGTWVFLKTDSPKENITSVPAKSKAKYTSRFRKYEFWYDPEEWIVDTTKEPGYSWDAHFNSTDYAIQGYCLDTRLSMTAENLESGIRKQWQSKGEIKSFAAYQDTLNGLPLTRFDMEYFEGGISYLYKGLIYSDTKGSFQFTVGTQKEVFEEDKDKIELLLKGLTKK